jgi:hypothetical protein
LSSISVPANFPSRVISAAKKKSAKLTLWPLVAATFFMVSGGTYGTEEIVHGAGYGHGILILLFLPVFWSLPTAFMIGELSSALPQEGGYYAWVRRGLGNFWGFQEAWLSLAASIFRYGDLPHAVCLLLEADVALVWTRESWSLRRPFRGGYLRAAKSCRNSRRGNHVAVALLSALGAVRADRGDGAP